MGKRGGKKGKRRAGRKVGAPQVLGPGAQTYRGPVVPRGLVAQQQIIARRLTYFTTAASNGSGNIGYSFSNNPTSTFEWTNYAALYTEYRTLAFRVRYQPNYGTYISSTTGTTTHIRDGPMVVYRERNSAASIVSTIGAAFSKEGAYIGSTQRPCWNVIKMSGSSESAWYNTIAPTANTAVNFVAFSLDTGVTYGNFFLEFLVQFRSPI